MPSSVYMAPRSADRFSPVSHRLSNIYCIFEPPSLVSRGLKHGPSLAYLTYKRCETATSCTASKSCMKSRQKSFGSHQTNSPTSVPVHGMISMAIIQAAEPYPNGDLALFPLACTASLLPTIPNTLVTAVSWHAATQTKLSGTWNPSCKNTPTY